MIRKLARLFLLSLLSLLTMYLILVAVASISIGLTNTERPGFWMPILCGLLLFYLDVFVIRLIVYIIKQIKAKDRYPYL